MDAFSRYIIWTYVGISNSTQVSCLRQYLEVIKELGFQPRFIRSDRGVETGMLAAAHFELQKNEVPDLEFDDCWIYGTSTANQRIEAWWQQLSSSMIWQHRVCISYDTHAVTNLSRVCSKKCTTKGSSEWMNLQIELLCTKSSSHSFDKI